MSDQQEDVGTMAARVPFAMVMISYFVKGSLFLFLNGPLLVLALRDRGFAGLVELLDTGIAPMLDRILSLQGNLLSASLLVACGTAAGFLVSPFERLASILVVALARALRPWLARLGVHREYFSPWDFRQSDQVALEHWLLSRRPEKAHWEWELMLYNLCWSMFFSVTTCVILVAALTWNGLGPLRAMAPGLLIPWYLVFALDRSTSMARTHEYHRRLAKRARA